MRRFTEVANSITAEAGSGKAVATVAGLVVVWLVVGPFVDFSRAWELTMVAGLPVATILMMIVLQHTQNRDSAATQLKLNELVHALEETSNSLIGVEKLSDTELQRLDDHYIEHRDDEHPARTSEPKKPTPR